MLSSTRGCIKCLNLKASMEGRPKSAEIARRRLQRLSGLSRQYLLRSARPHVNSSIYRLLALLRLASRTGIM